MATSSSLTIAGEVVGIYRYELCELDFYLFDEGDRVIEASEDDSDDDWESDDPDTGFEVGYVTTVLAARGNLEKRGLTHERLGQLESLLGQRGRLEPYFWHDQLRAYGPWMGLGEWLSCRHGNWARGSFPGEVLDLDRLCQDVATMSGLDVGDVLRGMRLFYYRFLLERSDRREEVRLDTQEVLATDGERRTAFEAPSLEAEIGDFLKAVQLWADRTPTTPAMLEKKVPAAPLVARLLDKLGHEQAPADLLKLIEADPDPQVRGLLVHSAR
jgi:hypothetical protein